MGVSGSGLRMLAPLFFLVLLLFSIQLSSAQATRTTEECCAEKLTYTDDGRIDEMFVLVGEQQQQQEESGCEGGCVFVRCLSLIPVSSSFLVQII